MLTKKLKDKKIKRSVRDDLPMPSTKLLCVNVHKIADKQKCMRYYYWRWIRNMQPKKLSLPFYFGSIVHIGIENISAGKSMKLVHKAMEKESRDHIKKHSIIAIPMEELMIHKEIAKITLDVYFDLFGQELTKWKHKHLEQGFKISLKSCPVYLTGTIDKYMEKGGNTYMDEYKTAKQVDKKYFDKLRFNKQINTYAVGIEAISGKMPSKCIYRVFKKPSIWVRQNESVPEFLDRFRDDMYGRPEFYFIREDIRFGKHTVRGVFNDIEAETFDLYHKYEAHTEEEILNPNNWAKNENACLEYGACCYLPMCSRLNNWEIYGKLFKMRDIRYDVEEEELQNPKLYKKRLYQISKNKTKTTKKVGK